MKKSNVVVPWDQGLHLRNATKLVHQARRYRSSISIKTADRVADAKSIISIMLLCATVGTMLTVEVSGMDEDCAFTAIQQVFSPSGATDNATDDEETENGSTDKEKE